jgi:hypothetical protein
LIQFPSLRSIQNSNKFSALKVRLKDPKLNPVSITPSVMSKPKKNYSTKQTRSTKDSTNNIHQQKFVDLTSLHAIHPLLIFGSRGTFWVEGHFLGRGALFRSRGTFWVGGHILGRGALFGSRGTFWVGGTFDPLPTRSNIRLIILLKYQ